MADIWVKWPLMFDNKQLMEGVNMRRRRRRRRRRGAEINVESH
jgi:hypothetical protein